MNESVSVSQTPPATQSTIKPPKVNQSRSPKVIILMFISLILGMGIMYVWQKYSQGELPGIAKKGCTMDAKICPDGSAVGRTGPNCEFAPCPSIIPFVSPTASMSAQHQIPTDWKIYKNDKYGFEVKYPPELAVVENGEMTITADLAAKEAVIAANVTNSFAFVPTVDSCSESTNCSGAASIFVYVQLYSTMLKRLDTLPGIQLPDVPIGNPTLEKEPITVSGIVGMKVTGLAMGTGEKMVVILLPKGSGTYSLKMISDNPEYLIQFDQILSTFRFD